MTSLRVLIAEDEQLVLMSLKYYLKILGHQVIGEATNGQEALTLIKEKKPDLIILDINLPIINGLEVAKKVKQEMPTPIIVVTGYSQAALIEEAKEADVNAYLVKPVDEDDIRPAIELSLHSFQQVQKLRKELKETSYKLEARKYIEKAKGIIQEKRKVSEREAMTILQKLSRDNNKKIEEIAKSIILADSALK